MATNSWVRSRTRCSISSRAWRNASSLGSSEFTQARGAFEAAAREAGVRIAEPSAAAPVLEVRFTLSENQTHYMIVEEVRKGDLRQAWIDLVLLVGIT